jgi:hypothetical protein
MFAVLIVAIMASTAIGSTPAIPTAEPGSGSPVPSLFPPSAEPTPTPSPPVNPALVGLLRALNDRLAASADALEAERARVNLRTPDVQAMIRQVNNQVAAGTEAVRGLGAALGRSEPGGLMAALYGTIEETASRTLDASVNNEDEYRRGAGELIQLIRQLEVLQAELEAWARPPTAAPASPSPSPGASPSPGTSGSPTPTPTTPPSASPSGAPSASPSGSFVAPPATGEQIENGGFESGVGSPWGLYLIAGASATLSADAVTPGAGASAARVDIATGSTAYSGISLRQPGLSLEAGRYYTLTISARSASDREIRVRIGSENGASYVNRIMPLTTTWSTLSTVFTAGVGDPDAFFEVQLGRADATTWIDTVSFAAVGG